MASGADSLNSLRFPFPASTTATELGKLLQEHWPWLLLVGIATALLWRAFSSVLCSGRQFPPGPRPWPVVGNIPNLAAGGPLPYQTLATLAQEYGPVMSVWLGSNLTVVVSSPEAAREVLREFDQACQSRPLPESAKVLTYAGRDIGFAPAGDHWKLMRKLCTTNLLTKRRLETFKPIRMEETSLMCGAVKEEAERRDGLVNVRKHLFRTSLNNIMRIALGKRFEYSVPGRPNPEADEFFAYVKDAFELIAAFNLADHVPALRLFDPAGVRRRCRLVRAYLQKFFEDAIDAHQRQLDALHLAPSHGGSAPSHGSTSGSTAGEAVVVPEDFCDALLTMEGEERLGRIETVGMLQDMLVAGADTSSTAAEWALLELLRHPEKLSRLQAEVDTVLGHKSGEASGKDTDVEAQLNELPYLRAVIKETLRLHPVGPLLVPHQTIAPVMLGGGKYYVPAGTMVQVNVWAITHDPAIWPKPHEFLPERFLEQDVDFKGTDFRFLPFGSGRRMCPGMALGASMVQLMLAHLVHAFDWSAGPAGLDNAEKFGLAVGPRKALEAIATPRQ